MIEKKNMHSIIGATSMIYTYMYMDFSLKRLLSLRENNLKIYKIKYVRSLQRFLLKIES